MENYSCRRRPAEYGLMQLTILVTRRLKLPFGPRQGSAYDSSYFDYLVVGTSKDLNPG